MDMKLIFATTVALSLAMMASAAPQRNRDRNARAPETEDEASATGKDAKITIDQFPKTGRASTLSAPSLQGASIIGQCYTKPRKWIVLEAKYSTFARWQDQLTFTWHVLLETKSATEKDRNDKIAPYSYFSTTVTYANIPKGTHAASVCLHPSYLERYGEPKAIGLVIANKEGVILAGDCESEIKGIKSHPKALEDAFWNKNDIMNAQDKNGEPVIERRQGLQDRSKTIWALVNPNDYEMVVQ
ncbi:MAG TPA: hypothetical protein DDY72_04115 [Verrucomicrobia bacterium]|nr:hypothetical protein [Verrucomicrobiota bacterium]